MVVIIGTFEYISELPWSVSKYLFQSFLANNENSFKASRGSCLLKCAFYPTVGQGIHFFVWVILLSFSLLS